MKKLDFTHKLKHRKRLTCGDMLKFIRKMKKDNFIVKNLFKKGLVCAFLFVVLLSICISFGFDIQGLSSKNRLGINDGLGSDNNTKEKLVFEETGAEYRAVGAGTFTKELTTFVYGDSLATKLAGTGTGCYAYNLNTNDSITDKAGYINFGKAYVDSNSDGTQDSYETLRWFIVGQDSGTVTDASGNAITDNLLLYAASPITYSVFNESDTDTGNYGLNETMFVPDGTTYIAYPSHYGKSTIRTLLNNMERDTSYFTTGEQSMMNTTKFNTSDTINYVSYSLEDKLYLAGGLVTNTYILAGSGANIYIDGGYFGTNDSWLRSDYTEDTDVSRDKARISHYYTDDSGEHTVVSYDTVTEKYAVKPLLNINLDSVYFATTAKSATSGAITDQTKSGITTIEDGLNLRFDGSSTITSSVVYDENDVVYSGTTGQVVVIQGNDSVQGDWYYSQYISSDVTDASIKAGTIKNTIGLSTQPNFEQCNIWIEETRTDGNVYARMATEASDPIVSTINQLVYEGITDSNVSGFTDGTNILTVTELGSMGITTEIVANNISDSTNTQIHKITMNGVNFTRAINDPLWIKNGVTSEVAINIVGDNKIQSTTGGSIWAKGDVYFIGDGTFTTTGQTGSNQRGLAVDGSVYFNQTGTVTTYGNQGIFCQGKIEINSGMLESSGLRGIYGYSGSVVVNGGEVRAYGIEDNGNTYGIDAAQNVVVNGGKLYAEGHYQGIHGGNNVYLYGGETEVYVNDYDVKGIHTPNLVIGDGTKTPKVNIHGYLGGLNKDSTAGWHYESCGIQVWSGMEIKSGELELNIENSDNTGIISGICLINSANLTVSGGSIVSKMNYRGNGNGDWYADAIHINNGILDVKSGSVTVYHGGIGNGISSVGGINLSGGTIISNIYGSSSKAIYSQGTINATSGTLNVFTEESANYGVYSTQTINIGAEDDTTDDTYITINRNYGDDSSGIYVGEDMNVYEGNITVGLDSGNNFNNAIEVIGTLMIDGGNTILYGTNNGIKAGALDIKNGIVESDGANTDGIIVTTMNITGGSVTSTGNDKGIVATTMNITSGDIEAYGMYNGISTTDMDMQGGYVFAKTTTDGSSRIDRRSIAVTNSLEMSDGHIDVELIGQRGVGLMVGNESNNATTNVHITGGLIEANVEGIYTKGMRVKGELKIGTVGTEGPTIIINGDIQNESELHIEGHSVNYDESGIYAEKNIEINSGNIKIDMKNSKVRDIETNKFNHISNPANNYIAAIMTKQSDDAGIVINGGTIDLNVDVEQPDGSYSAGDGMFTYGHITIKGGRITSTTNGGVYWVGNKLYHSSGINAKTDLTITGGEVRATNTNTTYEYNDELIGMGLYADGRIIVSGGHVIAQGIDQALAGVGTDISTPDDMTDAKLSILASGNYNGNPLSDYESSKNDEYKYVEIGVRHDYYLRYNETAKKIFKGEQVNGSDVTLGNDTDADDTNDTEDKLAALGIYVDSSTGVITLNNAIFESSTQYGLYIEGNATIYLTDNTVSRIAANKENASVDEKGICCDGTLTIEGPGDLIVSGATKAIEATTAINLTQAEGSVDYDKIVLYGSTTTTNEFDLIYYPNMSEASKWNYYKYVRIGSLPAYYFRYNVSEGKMYKVVGETATPITKNQVVYGWNIKDDTLYLDDFNFTTSASNALEIVSSNASDVAHIDIEDECSIKTLYDKYDAYYGIKCDIGARFTGTGTLDIAREYEFMDVAVIDEGNEYTGLSVNGDLNITGGTYRITAESYGIKVADDKKLTVNNATIIAKASAGGAIHLTGTSASCQVYGIVKVADNLEGGTVETISDYETNFSSYNTKKYIKIEPEVVSVTITWGDMNFIGENVWEPETHTYSGVIKPSNDDSGVINIKNDGNIPVKTSISINMTNSYGIVGKLDDGTMAKENVLINEGKKLNSTLSLTTSGFIENGISGTVGTVSVTLKDYRKE